jgi:hypothetical protein
MKRTRLGRERKWAVPPICSKVGTKSGVNAARSWADREPRTKPDANDVPVSRDNYALPSLQLLSTKNTQMFCLVLPNLV